VDPIEISFESSPALARLAALRYVQRGHGLGVTLMAVVAGVGGVALVMGFRQWYVITGIVLACVGLLAWVSYYLKSDKPFKSMPDPKVKVWIADDSIEFASSEQSSRIKWSRIKKVWKFPDVWLFFSYSESTFSLIPVEALSDETKALIEKQVIANGGRIR